MSGSAASSPHDVVIIGAGPAGCAAAAFLSVRGHRVLVMTRPQPPALWLSESIPASARKLLARIGALDALEGAGLVANEGNTVWWAGADERTERFPTDQLGVHAERRRLEVVFQGVATQAGADVRAIGPVLSARREPDEWSVRTSGEVHRGRWLLDASGRAGVLARNGLRRRERDAPTLALVGHWATDTGEAAEPGLTLVESYEDGWAWSVPRSDGLRCVTAMVDPRRTRLRRDLGLRRMHRIEIAKSPRLADRLGPGRWVGPTRACPASLYGAHRYVDDQALLIGDAGSFIDPLSSYGVKKALASAWLAGVVTHTALTEEAMSRAATDFHDAREREVYATYRARSVSFLEVAANAHGHAFWTARLEAARTAGALAISEGVPDATEDGLGERTIADDRVEAFIGSRSVREAFEDIRARPSIGLRPGRGLRTEDRPAIAGDLIRLRPHLVSDRLPGGARFARHVDLPRLVELAPRFGQVPDLFEAYNAEGGRAELPDFLAALALAVGAGFLDLT